VRRFLPNRATDQQAVVGALWLFGQCSVFVRNAEQLANPPLRLKIDERFVDRLADTIATWAADGLGRLPPPPPPSGAFARRRRAIGRWTTRKSWYPRAPSPSARTLSAARRHPLDRTRASLFPCFATLAFSFCREVVSNKCLKINDRRLLRQRSCGWRP